MIRGSIGRLGRFARRRSNISGRSPLILLYHRVAELRSDPWSLAVSPRYFAEHLEILQQHGRPMRLQQLSQALQEGDLPERAVVVTFDDGYADNLHDAKPLLEFYEIPTTFFLTTGYIGPAREFWWDELDRLLLQPGTLPERLSLNLNGNAYRWELGNAVTYSEDASRHRPYWSIWGNAYSSRYRIYHSLWELLHPMTEGERRKVLDELLAWAGDESAVRLSHRPLSLEEIFALSQGELFEIGAHTVTHPTLSALPADSQRDEILGSKARLEEILDCRVNSFSYPHGDFSAETIATVREGGFTCACTTLAGVVGRSTDLFQLPRLQVRDRDGEEFARWLSRWFW